jgi:methionine aminotransferase
MTQQEKIDGLAPFYQQKRDLFLESLGDTKFTYTPAKGTYFQLLNYRKVSSLRDIEFARKLTIGDKIASVPISVFYEDGGNEYYLRFCFAKDDDTLRKAGKLLNEIGNR